LAGQGPLGIVGKQIEPYVPEKANIPFLGKTQLKYPKVKNVSTAVEAGKYVAGDVGNILLAGLGSGGGAKAAEKRALNEAIRTIKSEAQFLSPTEKEAAKKVAGGFFKKTQPIVNDEEKRLASKFVDNLSSGNVVQKENKMKDFISQKGQEMTNYLTQNNYTFTTDKLKTALKNSLDEVFPPGVKEAAKNDSINLLLSKVKKNNLLNLWEGRSAFDKVIKGLFGKDELAAADMIKKAIRDTANNFVEETLKAKKVADVSYLPKLKDMADAYRVLEKIAPKAAFELGKSGLSKFLGTTAVKDVKNILRWTVGGGIVGGAINKSIGRGSAGNIGTGE
jgi:hypothetical protein